MLNERTPSRIKRSETGEDVAMDADLSALLTRVREGNIALRSLCFALDHDIARSIDSPTSAIANGR